MRDSRRGWCVGPDMWFSRKTDIFVCLRKLESITESWRLWVEMVLHRRFEVGLKEPKIRASKLYLGPLVRKHIPLLLIFSEPSQLNCPSLQ